MGLDVYVTLQGEDRIARYAMDAATGELTPRADVALPGGPAPVAFSPAGDRCYVAQRGSCQLTSFSRDGASGDLSALGTVSLPSDPCYLATDRSARFVLSAYYLAGAAAVHRVDERGAAVEAPVEWLEIGRGAHCHLTDRSNRFAFVPHIHGGGAPNVIRQYRFDAHTGRLAANRPEVVAPPGPLGPRHLCWHPTLDVAYVSNEQGCSVSAYDLDPVAGTLAHRQAVSTLPATWRGESKCSQIAITACGRRLYAPNRGHDSIAVFAVDGSGRLAARGHVPAEPAPRAFALAPGDRFALSAGLGSGALAVYAIDPASGALEQVARHPVGAQPMWVSVVPSPG